MTENLEPTDPDREPIVEEDASRTWPVAWSAQRVALGGVAVGLLVAARLLGGFAGAAVAGVGLGTGLLMLGRRRPHVLRRTEDAVDDW